METVYPLVQAIAHLSAIFPVIPLWESCARNIIETQQASTVSFVCKSAGQCPSNDFYRTIRTPVQTMFGLGPEQFPPFKECDLVFLPVHDGAVDWNREAVKRYRLRGKNNFKIVVVANMNETLGEGMEYMENLFRPMWKSGVVTVAVVLINETNAQVFTYFPFKGSCENVSPVLLGECKEVAGTIFDASNKVLNLNKCPLRITLVDDRPFINHPASGRLFNLINEIASRMNFTFESMMPESGGSGGSCGPEEFTGSRGFVANGTAHMAVGSFSRIECSTLEYVSLSYTQCLSWCTPVLSESDYIFLFIIKRFQPQVWTATIFTVLIVVTSVLFLRHATHDPGSTSVVNVALLLFAQVPLDFQSTRIRFILALWLCTCLVVRTAYEGELKSKAAVSLGTFVILTLKELLNTDLNLCGALSQLQVIKYAEEPDMRMLYNLSKVCKASTYKALAAAAVNKDSAVFTSDLRCRVVAAELDKDDPPLYSRTGGCYKVYQLTPMITLPGSPFKEHWFKIQQRCVESGLLKKWMDLAPYKRRQTHARAISVKHLLPVLFVLGMGCLCGFVVFLAENIVYRLRNDRN